MSNELQLIISGKSQVRYGAAIQAAIDYLREGEESGALDKSVKHLKREEAKSLKEYASSYNLWVEDIDLSSYISEVPSKRCT
jgi:hypothetical protein